MEKITGNYTLLTLTDKQREALVQLLEQRTCQIHARVAGLLTKKGLVKRGYPIAPHTPTRGLAIVLLTDAGRQMARRIHER